MRSPTRSGMSSLNVLPTGLAELPAARVLRRALEDDRVPHALLFYGPSLPALEALAAEMASSLLQSGGWQSRDIREHPDLFWVRPQNKMRQISAEQIRELIRNVQQTPHTAERKVAILSDADRLHTSASNIFLKTLEEPPSNTVLILLTSRYYSLLDTIRSRCMSFNIQIEDSHTAPEGWPEWLEDYRQWITLLTSPEHKPRYRTEPLLVLYDLIPRFESITKNAIAQVSGASATQDGYTLSTEEEEARVSGMQRALRLRFMQDIEQHTLTFIKSFVDRAHILRGERIIEQLEQTRFLLDVNLPEGPAMESFLLASLRIWSSPL